MEKKYIRKLITYLVIAIISMIVVIRFSLDDDIDTAGLVMLYVSAIITMVFGTMFMIGSRNAEYFMKKYATDVQEPEMNLLQR